MQDEDIQREMFELHTRVMINLGIAGAALARYETMIGEALGITEAKLHEQPGTPIALLVRRLLLAAQELIAAHKEIVKVGTSIERGSLQKESKMVQ